MPVEDSVFRSSVRNLVEMALHPSDILPAAAVLRRMEQGRLGHQAIQAACGDGWLIEESLTLDGAENGTAYHINGRMDAFFPADVPIIEEYKLSEEPVQEHNDAHWYQAVCYGHMVCEHFGAKNILVRLKYVQVDGTVLSCFEESMTAAACREAFFRFLLPALSFFRREEVHRLSLMTALKKLSFPYPAFRPGQRELAAYVYAAVVQKKRLLAQMPTGTGKSAGVLFASLKALGEGHTRQLFYLTSRSTTRLAPLDFLMRVQKEVPSLRVLVLTARDKICPAPARCHPDYCPRAKGHYDRQDAAIDACLAMPLWTEATVSELAGRYNVCPFELSLALTTLADVVLCDVNYAFDPMVQLERIFGRRKKITLLLDEAHHVPERVRASLSGQISLASLISMRQVLDNEIGTNNCLYTPVVQAMTQLRKLGKDECVVEEMPPKLLEKILRLQDALLRSFDTLPSFPPGGVTPQELYLEVSGFLYAWEHRDENVRLLHSRVGGHTLTVFQPDAASRIRSVTKDMPGTVFFSATLSPLSDMRRLLGCEEDDLLYTAPSPYPSENLLVLRQPVSTRFNDRESTANTVADAISDMVNHTPGNYLAFFPSYRYLELVAPLLHASCRVVIQERAMDEDARLLFIGNFHDSTQTLGLCVMGGVFAEGIDLPGDRLIGAAIVGLGLPSPCVELACLNDFYRDKFGDGFLYASLLPGIQKVAQAAGRVIRTEEDRGVVLLLDDRYARDDVIRLCPPHWRIRQGSVKASMDIFYDRKV